MTSRVTSTGKIASGGKKKDAVDRDICSNRLTATKTATEAAAAATATTATTTAAAAVTSTITAA